jgi:hypothetical protein
VSPVNTLSSICRHIESLVWPGVCITCKRSRPSISISPSPMRMSTKGAALVRYITTGTGQFRASCRVAEKWSAWVWVSIR